MAKDPKDNLLTWLRDAHGMEQHAASLLEKQADRLKDYPAMRERIAQHLEQTRSQAERVQSCINRLDTGGTSTIKDIGGKFMAGLTAMTTAFSADEVVKTALGDFAFENFEAAAYRSLVAAAEAVGDTRTAEVCREILTEEEAMASWVGDRIPDLTRAYLERGMMDRDDAKR